MNQKITAVMRDPFIRNNAVFFVGSMIVAVLNYLYHPVLSRILSVQNFGDVETLISFLAQAGILLGIFGKIVINTITHSTDPIEERNSLQSLYTIALLVVGATSNTPVSSTITVQ